MLNRSVCLFDCLRVNIFNDSVQLNSISIVIQFYVAYKFVKYTIYISLVIHSCKKLEIANRT